MTKEQAFWGFIYVSQIGAFIGAFIGVKTHNKLGFPAEWAGAIGGFLGNLLLTTAYALILVWTVIP